MAISAAELAEYSWEDIQKAAKQAMVQGVLVQAMSEPGRSVTFGSVAEAQKLYTFATQQIALASGQASGRVKLISR